MAPDYPNGIWLDATGVPHLFGGEAAMLAKITARLQQDKITAHASIADTPGAAWACAHYSQADVVPSEEQAQILSKLPVLALRIPKPVAGSLSRVGIRTIGDVLRLPRKLIPYTLWARCHAAAGSGHGNTSRAN